MNDFDFIRFLRLCLLSCDRTLAGLLAWEYLLDHYRATLPGFAYRPVPR